VNKIVNKNAKLKDYLKFNNQICFNFGDYPYIFDASGKIIFYLPVTNLKAENPIPGPHNYFNYSFKNHFLSNQKLFLRKMKPAVFIFINITLKIQCLLT